MVKGAFARFMKKVKEKWLARGADIGPSNVGLFKEGRAYILLSDLTGGVKKCLRNMLPGDYCSHQGYV